MSELHLRSDLLRRYPASETIDGIPCYAPQLLGQETGYDPSHHAEIAALAEGNWWYTSRNALIVYALTRWFPQARSYLELGCGTGLVLKAVAEALPGLHSMGSELFLSGLQQARDGLPGVELVQG